MSDAYRQVLIDADGARRTLDHFIAGRDVRIPRPLVMTPEVLGAWLLGEAIATTFDVYEPCDWDPQTRTATYAWAGTELLGNFQAARLKRRRGSP